VAQGIEKIIVDLPCALTSMNLINIQTPMKTSEFLADLVLRSLNKEWAMHDEKMETLRIKNQKKTGFVKATPKGCDWDWTPPGENGFVPQQCIVATGGGDDEDNEGGGSNKPNTDASTAPSVSATLKIFCDVPVIRLCGGGPTVVTKLSLKGVGIGLHGAIVLAELLKRNNTVTHIYLSENNIGKPRRAIVFLTRGASVSFTIFVCGWWGSLCSRLSLFLILMSMFCFSFVCCVLLLVTTRYTGVHCVGHGYFWHQPFVAIH